jgi:phage gpG-like protein
MAINIFIPIGSFRNQVMKLSNDAQNMAKEFGNMKEPLNDSIDKVIIPSIENNFRRGGRPSWERLADSTVERLGSSSPILDETGVMRNVATSKRIWNVDNFSAIMNLSDPDYAKYHQTGTADMPQRVFAVLQNEDMNNIEEIFDAWVNEMVASRGGW